MNTRNAGNDDVVVVVSAQGDTTDDLITKAAEITSDPSHREMDMLPAGGGNFDFPADDGLAGTWRLRHQPDRLAGGLQHRPRLLQGPHQRLDTEALSSELARNRVVVVAGFQGLNRSDDITTLGRGGSDTSAVALAAALHADRCQIFTDVEGVYT